MTRSEWPELSPAEIVMATVLTVGAVVAGVAQGDQVLAALLDRLCTETACRPVGLAVSGWAAVGGPLLLAGVVFLLSRPSVTALYAMLGCVALLGFGFAAMFAGAEDVRDTYPDIGPLGVGLTAANLALIVGGSIAGPSYVTSFQRPRYSTTARLPAAAPPLFVVGLCQVVALAAVLLWVTALR